MRLIRAIFVAMILLQPMMVKAAGPGRFRGDRLDVRVVRAGRVSAAISPLRSSTFEPQPVRQHGTTE